MKKARELLSLSQIDVAQEVGVDQTTISRWESLPEPEIMHNVMHAFLVLMHKLLATSNLISIIGSLEEIQKDIVYIKQHMSYAKTRSAVHNDMQPDPGLKPLVIYFYNAHLEKRGYSPSKYWARDMKIMKEICTKGDYGPGAVRQCIDAFFDYKGRTKTGMRDFQNSVDNTYGYLQDKAEGRR